MRYSDYSTILTNFGCHPEIIQLKERRTDPVLNADQFRKVCTYVESGFPTLASFAGHVVSLTGHTMDRRLQPKPDGDGLVDSSAFLKQFIVVDDNFFPYQLLGRKDDPENYGSKYPHPYDLNSICVAVCPLPEKVFLPVGKAREQFLTTLKRLRADQTWATTIAAGTSEPLVTRMLISTSTSFKRRRLEKATENSHVKDPLAMKIATFHLPHFIWLMEIAPLGSFLAGKCTAEIVLDATANKHEACLLYARVGQNLLLHDSSVSVKNAGVSIETFEQFTHNLGEQ